MLILKWCKNWDAIREKHFKLPRLLIDYASPRFEVSIQIKKNLNAQFLRFIFEAKKKIKSQFDIEIILKYKNLTFAKQAIRFDSLLIIQLILRNNFADLKFSGIQGLFLKVTRSFDDIFSLCQEKEYSVNLILCNHNWCRHMNLEFVQMLFA
ncbi:hypothetical protein T05_2973 [Trichinella murrelli]|uniref:Uncharacterized protein n=1 Tax=Trichinella murrelli TaxID=144512 RepID=A0A0V0UEK8_9BILA|nr:hypothetical protein T05_2973 [Trichinella murrelli]